MHEELERKIRLRTDVARAHSHAIAGIAGTMMVKEGPEYDGRARELFPIVLVNLILAFLTLGIYRFWAKTRVRRYFLSRISFLGDRLEYTGTGRELFIGFLIVMAVLIPLSMLSELILTIAARHGGTGTSVFYGVYFILLYFLYFFATYRAQRYRLSRTTWRGVRGGQEGSALTYAGQAMGWLILVLLTVGLAYPLMRVNLMRYKINHASFGNETFQFEGSAGRLFLPWLLPWIGVALFLGSLVFLIIAGAFDLPTDATSMPPELIAAYKTYGPYLGLGISIYMLTQFWYRAAEIRYFSGHTTFDKLSFTSTVSGIQIFLPYLAYGFVLIILVFGSGALAAYSLQGMAGGQTAGTAEIIGGVITGVVVLVALMVVGTLQPIIVQNWLIRVYCNKLLVQGSFSPAQLLQNQLDIPGRGEGLADALDIDAF